MSGKTEYVLLINNSKTDVLDVRVEIREECLLSLTAFNIDLELPLNKLISLQNVLAESQVFNRHLLHQWYYSTLNYIREIKTLHRENTKVIIDRFGFFG